MATDGETHGAGKRRRPTPLGGLGFFLDIADGDRKATIQTQLQALGARVHVVFDVKGVTHLVTDCKFTPELKKSVIMRHQQQRRRADLRQCGSAPPSAGHTSPPRVSPPGSPTTTATGGGHRRLTWSLPSVSLHATILATPHRKAAHPLASSACGQHWRCTVPDVASPSRPLLPRPIPSVPLTAQQPQSSPMWPLPLPLRSTSLLGSPLSRSSSPALPPISTLTQLRASAIVVGSSRPISLDCRTDWAVHPNTNERQQQDTQPERRLSGEELVGIAYGSGKTIYHIDNFLPWLAKSYDKVMAIAAAKQPKNDGNKGKKKRKHNEKGEPCVKGEESVAMAVASSSLSSSSTTTTTTITSSATDVLNHRVRDEEAPNDTNDRSPALSPPSSPSQNGRKRRRRSATAPAAQISPSSLSAASTTSLTYTSLLSSDAASIVNQLNQYQQQQQQQQQPPRSNHGYVVLRDLEGQFKLLHKEFPPSAEGRATFPCINYDAPHGMSPFLDASAWNSKHPKQQQAHHDQQQQHAPHQQHETTRGTVPYMPEGKRAHHSKRRKKSQAAAPSLVQASNKPGWCEQCSMYYDNLQQHLSGSEHRACADHADHRYGIIDELFRACPLSKKW